MSRIIVASILGLSLMGEAVASSHREAPTGGSRGKAVAEASVYDQLSALYHVLLGDAPVAPVTATKVSVRRPGYTPGQ